MSERVLVLPTEVCRAAGLVDGFTPDAAAWFFRLGPDPPATFMDRAEAETDPRYKQVVAYTVCMRGDEILCYRRGSAGGEARLHHLRSLGIGGHVEHGDFTLDPVGLIGVVGVTAQREVLEEIGSSVGVCWVVGVVNDDSNPVGQVHVGVVVLATVQLQRLQFSPEIHEPSFQPVHLIDPAGFEPWSRHVLGWLQGRVPAATVPGCSRSTPGETTGGDR